MPAQMLALARVTGADAVLNLEVTGQRRPS